MTKCYTRKAKNRKINVGVFPVTYLYTPDYFPILINYFLFICCGGDCEDEPCCGGLFALF